MPTKTLVVISFFADYEATAEGYILAERLSPIDPERNISNVDQQKNEITTLFIFPLL